MHEQLMREFAERAEDTIDLPDLAQLEVRGRRLRRGRLTAVATAAVTVLVAGTLVATARGDERTAPPPSDGPGVVLDDPVPDKELAAGREYTVEVYGQNYAHSVPQDRVMITRFTVVGTDWIWLKDRVLKLGPGTDVEAGRFNYAVVQVSLIDRVATTTQCSPTATVWADAAGTPLEVAREVTTVPGVAVVEEPTPTVWGGYPAAHLQLTVPQVCRKTVSAVLWSVFPSSSTGSPGVGTVFRSGQRVDLWIVDVEGSMVAVSVEHTPGLPRPLMNELHTIADSVELDVVPE
ncbi:MAG: hypothetical protein ABWZ91_06955 [Nocardioides sp.]